MKRDDELELMNAWLKEHGGPNICPPCGVGFVLPHAESLGLTAMRKIHQSRAAKASKKARKDRSKKPVG